MLQCAQLTFSHMCTVSCHYMRCMSTAQNALAGEHKWLATEQKKRYFPRAAELRLFSFLALVTLACKPYFETRSNDRISSFNALTATSNHEKTHRTRTTELNVIDYHRGITPVTCLRVDSKHLNYNIYWKSAVQAVEDAIDLRPVVLIWRVLSWMLAVPRALQDQRTPPNEISRYSKR